MSTCRIGQNERCCKTGCEFSKAFGVHCHSEKSKFYSVNYGTDDFLKKAEHYSKQQKETHLFSFDSPSKGGKKNKKRRNKPKNHKNKRQRIYDRGNGICYLCGEPVEFRVFTIDHVIPLSRGGSNDISNLRPAHASCNLKKGNKILKPLNK